MSGKVYVADCHLGKGIFATNPIARGELIFAFTGPLITLEQAIAKGGRESDVVQIGPRLYIDPDPPGIFINHSCDPNAGVSGDRRVVALRDIQPDEEVCFDYSTTMSEKRWTMRCDCRTPGCRGMIGDFHKLPAPVQQKYLGLGIVSGFIVHELRNGNGNGHNPVIATIGHNVDLALAAGTARRSAKA